ncbi:unnamed protein product, partial [Dicrocoelium dendriticum]
MSSTLDDSMSVLPGESGSVAEILGSSESLTSHSGSTEPADSASAIALTAAFHFTGTSASANGATMQECFLQSVVSSAQQYELLITRLRGLSREWTEFCDQEISLQLGSDDRSDAATANSTRTIAGAQNVVSTAAHTTSSPSVNTRIRRSLLPSMQFADRCLSVLRYLGAVETDKL